MGLNILREAPTSNLFRRFKQALVIRTVPLKAKTSMTIIGQGHSPNEGKLQENDRLV